MTKSSHKKQLFGEIDMIRMLFIFIPIESSIPKPPKIINFTKPANHPNRRIKLPDIDQHVTVESVKQTRKDRAYFYNHHTY